MRLDYLDSMDSFRFEDIVEFKGKLILTIRDPNEGGENQFRDGQKFNFMMEAVKKGFLVDVEGEFADKHKLDCNGQIVSRHYMESAPGYEDMAQFLDRYEGIARITKLAVKEGKNSRINLIRLLGNYRNIAVMEMDGEGSSRLLFSALGSKLLYCHAGEKTSPGQLGCEEALEILDLMKSQP